MNSYLSFLQRFKYLLLILTSLIVIGLAGKITTLTFDGSYRIWFGKDSIILKEYDQFCGMFGNDDSLLVVFSDSNGIVNPKALQSIERLTNNLKLLPDIVRVNSILNYQYIHTNPDDDEDIIVENFISNPESMTQEQFHERQTIALNDSMVQDFVISKDGTTTMISAKLSSFAGMDKGIRIELVKSIQKILDEESKKTGYSYHMSGAPVSDAALQTIADNDAMYYIPTAFLVIIAVLYFFFRTLWGVLIPIVTVILASTITLAFYAFMGLELNNFSINIPIFITAIGIADAVHFYTAWTAARHCGFGNQEAIHKTFDENLAPMLLTTLSTAIGFGSLISSDIVPMSTLGYTVALGSLTALGLTFFLMPLILLSTKSDYIPTPIRTVRCLVKELNYAYFVVQHDKKILIASLIFAFGIGSGVVYTKFDSNSIKYFDTDVEVSKAAYYTMDTITGPSTYEIIIDSLKDDGIKEPTFLKTVQQFDREFKAQFPEIRYTNSLLDVIERFQTIMNPTHTPDETVGNTKEMNAQYLLIYSLSLPQGMEINDKMDINQRQLRFTVQADIVNSSRSLEIIQWSEDWWKNHGLHAKVQGQVSMFAKMQSMVANTLFSSLAQTLLVIAIMMFFIIRNLKLLVAFLIPNLLPLFVSLGFLGWMNIPIDIGIAVAAVIVLGLAVDDTVYFFNKYSEARKLKLSAVHTFDYILEHSGSAMVFTTVILSCAFAIFIFSDFIPNVHFAIMTISTMILALLADLLLMPALMSVMEKTSFNQSNATA